MKAKDPKKSKSMSASKQPLAPSPSDQEEKGAPTQPKKEGSRWAEVLQKQTEENNRRLQEREL